MMKKCLSCGKPIEGTPQKGQWHQACSKKFFGTDVPPLVSLSEQNLELIASQAIKDGITLPGVQKKLSLTLVTEKGQQP